VGDSPNVPANFLDSSSKVAVADSQTLLTLIQCIAEDQSIHEMHRGLGDAMQTMYALVGDAVRALEMPGPDALVLPGIRWGCFDELLTPAYWHGQVWHHGQLGTYSTLRLGSSLLEETAACLLGGFGMKAERGLAAFRRLRDGGLLSRSTPSQKLELALCSPFEFQGRQWRYRFPRQKARYLAGCLTRLSYFEEPTDDVELRDKLATLPGVGLKTASWIVRNHRSSNAVAIVDVHIMRAGRLIGLFSPEMDPSRQYREMERRFLGFAAAIGSAASLLDGLMWDQMRWFPPSLATQTTA
jgi:thermostable 8-oxoguanine DNA glycosylase